MFNLSKYGDSVKLLTSLSSLALASLVLLPMNVEAKKSKTKKIEKPFVVGTPPSDAGRGLVRISKKEIRHYSGDRNKKNYLVSKDNGKTWDESDGNEDYPISYGGIRKESPAIVQNPLTKEFIRVQPIRGFIFISKGGIDGKWGVVTKSGELDFSWKETLKKDPKGANYKRLSGIMRTPTFVNKGKVLLIPNHGGSTSFHRSVDGGLTWSKSKGYVSSPRHKPNKIDKGYRWQNGGVEGSLVELSNGKLWCVVRTSQNQHYESFSSDYGKTWTKAVPSRFFGQLTMITLLKLKDGRILSSWTNTQALPENVTATGRGEDAFTNRDSHHFAISEDDGKTWIGFREIILDEIRNHEQYATLHGSEDRGKHQSELIQLSKNKVLVSLGQHHEHRRLMIVDLRYLYEKKRKSSFENGLEDWTVHTFVPQRRGHCAYNRKQSSFIKKGKGLQIRRVNDPSLADAKKKVDYQRGGATWNFPNGKQGEITFKFTLDKDNQGTQISLTDRLFNACDTVTQKLAIYTLNLKLGQRLGSVKLKAGKKYKLTLKWNGVERSSKCSVFLDGKKVDTLKAVNESPNGLSYIHFISTAESEDQGFYLKSVKASVK